MPTKGVHIHSRLAQAIHGEVANLVAHTAALQLDVGQMKTHASSEWDSVLARRKYAASGLTDC